MIASTQPGPRPAAISRLVSTLIVIVAIAGTASTARSQGNLSGWGLGFPTGQLSTRAEGTGGAIGEIDALSLVNPAALSFIGTTTLFFQLEPEYRRVIVGSANEGTTTARYPLFAGLIPVGSNWVVGLTSATMLDRASRRERDGISKRMANWIEGTEEIRSRSAMTSSRS